MLPACSRRSRRTSPTRRRRIWSVGRRRARCSIAPSTVSSNISAASRRTSFGFREEAKKRKEANAKPEEKKTDWTLIQHLSNVIAAAERSGQTEVLPIRHRIDYTRDDSTERERREGRVEGARAGCRFRRSTGSRGTMKLLVDTPELRDIVIADNGAPHRTICFTHTIDDPSKALDLQARVRVHVVRVLPDPERRAGEAASRPISIGQYLAGAPAAHRRSRRS